MKLVTAIVKPFKLDDVKEALKAVGIQGLAVTDAEYRVDFLSKARLEIAVDDGDLDDVVDVIRGTAATGKIGDGKIWVTAIESIMRIRTGERGADAI